MTRPYRACNCRAPATTGPDGKRQPGKLLGKTCPDLGKKNHGGWFVRYEAPVSADGTRRQPRLGPFRTEREAKEALTEALSLAGSGRQAADRNTRVAEYLTRWLSWHEAEVKPSTLASYAEAFRLYWIPAIGHLRLADLREEHIRDTHAAMAKLNTPDEAGDRSDLMRRLVQARGTRDGLRYRRLPLTRARIKRVTAPLVAALNDCKALPVNPAADISLKVRKSRPLLWTGPRAEQWRKTGKRPARVMVWTPEQAGAFLDSIEGDRLYSLYHLAAYWGLRRSELAGLEWADVDLGKRRVHVRQGQVDDELDDTKSEDSDRIITIDPATADVLKAWRKAQLAERMAWGPAWTDTSRVFTREDGQPLRPGGISEHFGVLIRQAGLPPVRFHDLRHGSASMLLAAGVELKVVSETMGHSTSAFTADVYVTVLEELSEATAAAIAAFVPRKTGARNAQ
jgi:integrase